MKPVPIGKGLFRITVRSKAKREKLEAISDVVVEGMRVIYPEWLHDHIARILTTSPRKKKTPPDQTSLF